MKKLILSIIDSKKRYLNRPLLIAVTGRARSGKTTFASVLSEELAKKWYLSVIYRGDWRLKDTSAERRKMILNSFHGDLNKYIKRVFSHNWWDFKAIYKDLRNLCNNKTVILKSFHNRLTWDSESNILKLIPKKWIIIFENGILWEMKDISIFEKIFFLTTPDSQCLLDSLKTDISRRNALEIASRFILTSQGENIFFEQLVVNYWEKITYIDRNGESSNRPIIEPCIFFPVPIKTEKQK